MEQNELIILIHYHHIELLTFLINFKINLKKNVEAFGVREILDIEDEKRPNGKFRKRFFSFSFKKI